MDFPNRDSVINIWHLSFFFCTTGLHFKPTFTWNALPMFYARILLKINYNILPNTSKNIYNYYGN